MDFVFLDTSGVLKLYLPELGSSWLRNFVIGKQIVISELSLFESATALRRRYLEATYTREQANDLFAQIYQDRINFENIPLGGDFQLNELSTLVFNLPSNLRIRALDGLQLVAAKIALNNVQSLPLPNSFIFVTSDRQLLQVAQSQSFMTENPEDHP
jgi:predicted nucleic acid-binding protein